MRNLSSSKLKKELQMSLRNRLHGFIIALGLIATFGIAAHAQQPAETNKAAQPQMDGMRKGRGHHRGTPVLRIMRDLNLTDAQQQQARTIVERFTDSIQPQRQALMEIHKQRETQGTISDDLRQKAQELRQQIHESQKLMQTELLAILTTEQRAQYEKLEQEWKARRAEHRSRRNRGERMPPEEQ
jgi:protein CpxP